MKNYAIFFILPKNKLTFPCLFCRVILDKTLNDGVDKLDDSEHKLEKALKSFDTLTTNLFALSGRFDDKMEEMMKCLKSKLKILTAASTGSLSDRVTNKLIPKINEKIDRYTGFFEEMSTKIQVEYHKIDSVKAKLLEEMQFVNGLQLKIVPVKWYINSNQPLLHDDHDSITELIADSTQYRKTHKPINE